MLCSFGSPPYTCFVPNYLPITYLNQSFQLAPGVPTSKRRPLPGTLPEWGFHWYPNLTYGLNTSINPFFYGTLLAQTKAEEPSTCYCVIMMCLLLLLLCYCC